ncbi:tail protein X [Roseibium sp.]|uniref:tail protein X n=1 Tax=Roseibium sp. TaxID=1936156 RepID=UPI003D134A85
MRKTLTIQGDMCDLIAFREYGTEAASGAIWDANPGLADHGPVLPAGLEIVLPDWTPPELEPALSPVRDGITGGT